MSFLIKKLMIIVSVFLGYLVQVIFVPRIQLGIVVPNVLLIVVASISFAFSTDDGILAGILAGLLMDVMFGKYLGFYILIYVSLSYISSIVAKFYLGNVKKILYAVIFGEMILYGTIMYIFFYLMRGRYFVFTYLFNNILPSAFYTLLVSLLIVPIVLNGNLRYLKYREKKENYFA